MKICLFLIIGMILMIQPALTFGQAQDWRKFVALETSRDKIEEVLGEPVTYLDTFGTYKTDKGKFSVWYSKGGCHKDFKGLQYSIEAQIMTQLRVYVKGRLPLESYVNNRENYKKTVSLMNDNRFHYASADESIVYETIVVDESEEFVYVISIQPAKNKQHFLCNDIKF